MKINKIKGIIIGITAVVLGGMTASAAELPYSVEYDYSNQSFTVSGDALTDGEWVSVQILKPNMTITADGDAAVLFRRQYTVKDSKYTFRVEYDDGINGVCSGVLASSSEDEATPFEVLIVSSTAMADIYGDINAAAKANDFEAFKTVVNANIESLTGVIGANGNLSSELSDYFEYVKKNELQVDQSAQNTKILNTFLAIDKLNSGSLENIQDVIGTIYLDDELKNYYTATATTGGIQSYFTDKLSGQDINTLEELDDTFKEALILTVAKYGSAYGELEDVVEEYGSVIGITGSASASVYKSLLGVDHVTATAFKAAYDRARNSDATSSNLGTGGIGGGSGGGSGSAGKGDATSAMGGIKVGISGESTANTIDTIDVEFNDIEGVTWASEAILALADKGIVNGKEPGKFKPDDDITREEFVKILIGALGMSDSAYSGNTFSDVNDADWFCKYVNIANENQIVKGIGDGKFGVGENITRQDMIVMLYNALVFKNAEITSAELTFEDRTEIADYAQEAVSALYGMGAVNGVTETTFEPNGTATRAQAAKVVYGVLKHLQ